MLRGLGQLIYTSFPGVGLKKLFSDQVPKATQEAFLNQIVYKNWNSYKPPDCGEQAVYLYQPNLKSCIFGWLYSDSVDEHGRNIPYFLGYLLEEKLNTDYLEKILTCLERGPASFWEYDNNPDQSPGLINIEDIQTYQPVRKGLLLPPNLSSHSYTELNEKKELDFFVFSDRNISETFISDITSIDKSKEDLERSNGEEVDIRDHKQSIASASNSIRSTLQELMNKPLEIQSAFLISSEGQLITPAINMDEDSALIIAGRMIYLAQSTNTELEWETIEKIFIQGKEGYIILAYCTSDVFLLIQAGKTLMGLLDGEVNRTIQRIRGMLPLTKSSADTSIEPLNVQELAALNGTIPSVE